MITELELDTILASWLAEGAERAPAEDLPAALVEVDRTQQRHGTLARRIPARALGVAGPYGLWAAAMLIVVTAAWGVLGAAPGRVASASIDMGDFPWAATDPAPESVAFVALLPVGAPANVYWRAAAYDRFDLAGWSQTGIKTVDVPSGEPLLGPSAEAPAADRSAAIRATILPDDYRGGLLLSPGTPVRVDIEATVRSIGTQAWLAGVQVRDGATYTVEARQLRLDDETVVSAGLLRAAGREYPAEIAERYTAVPPGAIGPDARRLLATILASTPARDPYDLAVTIDSYLKDPRHFTYATNLVGQACTSPSIVECFARTRTGFCLHYATTMAILLRAALPDAPIPTRLVQGFLPGDRSGGTETVSDRLAHAWVEVYFEGFGWIPFDPTAGVGRPSRIQQGRPISSPGLP